MNNAKSPPYIPVPLELLGGLYTEASPETLPLGASPLVINCDYILGSVYQRPGKQNAFYFNGLFVEHVTGYASSVADAGSTGEAAWSNPSNATLNLPPSYASVLLNFGGAASSSVDQVLPTANDNSIAGPVTLGTLTPSFPNEWAIVSYISIGTIFSLSGSWNTSIGILNTKLVSGPLPITGTVSSNGGAYAVSAALLYTANGVAPTVQNSNLSNTELFGGPSYTTTWATPTTAGNSIIVALAGGSQYTQPVVINDTQGNIYTPFASAVGIAFTTFWLAQNIPGGANQVTITANLFPNTYITVAELNPLGNPAATGGTSQQLQTINYAFSIPSTQNVIGFQVEVLGKQSDATATSGVNVSLINPSAASVSLFGQLPASDGTLTLATQLTNWGLALSNNTFNNPSFGVQVKAVAPGGVLTTFSISAVKIKVWLTPNPAPNINYMKTFAETGGEVLNMMLGSDGVFYQEDAINAANALTGVYTAIAPNSFAQSATVNDREFIAVSNQQNGTDIPYTYTPPNFDRLSQVGPGAPPSATTTSTGSTVKSITQGTKQLVPIAGGAFDGSWLYFGTPDSANGTSGVGNTMLWVFPAAYVMPSWMAVGINIVISGVQALNGLDPNNGVGTNPSYYTVTSVGSLTPGNQYYSGFTVTLPFTGSYVNFFQAGSGFTQTLATMTTNVQIPDLEVGSQFQLAGTGGAPPAGYDSTWTVLTTPNAAQMQITSTQLLGNVATFAYVLITGTAPAAGQYVTVTGTLNGNGIFNLTNQVIAGTNPGTFSINMLGSANVSNAAETGAGIIFGTIFTFDPLVIIGNKLAGTIVTTGIIGSGVRKVCYSFLTRNGFITAPSPILTFNVVSGASGIAIAHLATGPSNVIARIIHLTAADGSNFYNIPEPVTVISNGVKVINSSTWVNDNITTNVILSFSDGVLLAADQIDIQGNNLFECTELGSCVALIPYAQRLFSIGEQNKVTNFLNWSFDGGVGSIQGNIGSGAGTTTTYPLGWTVDLTNGNGGSVIASPIFGSAYLIKNASGITQAVYGMITQNAFQDEFFVPIIQASTTYSVRITCSVPTGAASGNLVFDLYSAKYAKSFGTYTLALSSITSSMSIYSGTLLTSSFAPVPNDLVIRLYATNIPNGVQVQVDRVEPFPTEMPNLNTQVIGSYQSNFEAFDRLSGVVLATQQNQQPVVSAFTLSGTLYLVKSGSIAALNDNNTTEPAEWNIPRVISNSVGAVGPYAVTTGIDAPNSGEEWALIAGRPGIFLFNGSQPVKLSEEIQSLWDMINWAYGYTIWVQNDITTRRILVGVPLKTPNKWLPTGIIPDNSNPTTPNVVLELNYKQLNTSGALMESVQIHRSYSGKLIASDIVRKWSIWTIKTPCAAFLSRADKTNPVFMGNSDATGKIYQLIENLLQDDGSAIDQIYFTAGFAPTEVAEGRQLGVTRYLFDYATMIVDGAGTVTITVYPNAIDSPYVHVLLPALTLTASTNGDLEIPVNETGNRLFVMFNSNAVGSGFKLSRMVMVMRQDPWSPVRGT